MAKKKSFKQLIVEMDEQKKADSEVHYKRIIEETRESIIKAESLVTERKASMVKLQKNYDAGVLLDAIRTN